MTWIYNEDGALKFKLQGLTVTDATAPGGRRVPVRYRLPEDELATLTYPTIILEHDNTNFAPERQHRGFVTIPYAPEGLATWWPDSALHFDPTLSPYSSYFPLAYNLDYKVTVYCRKMVEHLQPLIATLALDPYLPAQMGRLDVPQDGSIRNLFLMGGPTIQYGKDTDDKRLYRATYLIRVMTEVIPHVYTNGIFGQLVTQLNLNLGDYSDVTDVTTELLATNQALISTGPRIAFNEGFTPPPPIAPGIVEEQTVSKVYQRRPQRRATTMRSR